MLFPKSEGLLKNFDYNLVKIPYEKILKYKDSLIEKIEKLKDERSKNYKLEKLKDYLTYKEFEPQLIESFEKNKDEVSERVADSLRNNQNLKEKWSLDIMIDGDLFYFIDSAEMKSSALANFVNVNSLEN